MSLINSTRSGCRDVFCAFLVKDATYDGDLEIPRIMPESSIPNKLILFSKALKSDDHDCWVCFYEDDAAFERLWNNPNRYLPILKQYKGMHLTRFQPISRYAAGDAAVEHLSQPSDRSLATEKRHPCHRKCSLER